MCWIDIVFWIYWWVIGYFILRKNDPQKARIFLYLGIILTAVGIGFNILFAAQLGELEQNFGLDVDV